MQMRNRTQEDDCEYEKLCSTAKPHGCTDNRAYRYTVRLPDPDSMHYTSILLFVL
jgi:hypothetical protein